MTGMSPLDRWELQGFRSVSDRVRLDLGPLNVLVGANSAGKSSLIQSILLAGQTLSASLTPRPLLLNGPLVQLGLPSDCVHEGGKEVSFGFGFSSAGEYALRSVRRAKGRIDASAVFSIKGESLELTEFDLTATRQEREEEALDLLPIEQRISYKRQTKTAVKNRFRELGLRGARLSRASDLGAVPIEVSDETLPLVTAARFRQFLPDVLFEMEDENATALEGVLDYLLRTTAAGRRHRRGLQSSRGDPRRHTRLTPPSRSTWAYRSGVRGRQLQIPKPVVRFLADYLAKYRVGSELDRRKSYTFEELLEDLSEDAANALAELRETDWYESRIDDLPENLQLTPARADDPLDSLVENARRFFGRYVRHLGPLREEPKPLYGLSEAASGDSVGRSGEYTAAVLESYANRPVECPKVDRSTSFTTSLGEAVNYWLNGLGLLSSVDVQERGKLGYEVKLQIEGVSRELDLTAVGVGVSQALPVIVQGLIAPPGSLVMFEQPELHLHPDVQAAIGDFCLALSASGRQIILETHSEYLINRLRLRAVEDRSDEIPKLVRLFFVERSAGTSEIRPLELTTYGGLTHWPAGFLDQASREAEAIMEAVERKEQAADQGTD